MMIPFLKVASLSLFLTTIGFADVLVGDATFANSSFPGEMYFGLSQSIPLGEGLFVFSFTSDEALNTVIQYRSIAEYCKLFTISEGVDFNADYVSSHTPLVANDNNPGTAVLPYSSSNFTLAYWDDRSIWAGSPSVPDVMDYYGWVTISMLADWDANTLAWSTVDGATALTQGIKVGSYTQIPEPGTYGIAFSALALAFVTLKRKTRCAVSVIE
jgi:hypothetical protein